MDEWSKGTELWNMMSDYFKLCRELWNVGKPNKDNYWKKVFDRTQEFSKKYGKTQFVADLTLSLINELERREKLCELLTK